MAGLMVNWKVYIRKHHGVVENFLEGICKTIKTSVRVADNPTEIGMKNLEDTRLESCMYKEWAIKSSPRTATFSDLLCFV
jgi:hypothetical protein